MSASDRVREAREDYWFMTRLAYHVHPSYCEGAACDHFLMWMRIDAASLSLDMAEAEASIERTRQAIPW